MKIKYIVIALFLSSSAIAQTDRERPQDTHLASLDSLMPEELDRLALSG